MTTFPTTPDTLTSHWLSNALHDAGVLQDTRVHAVQIEPVGEQGQTSQVVRLTLSYDHEVNGAPNTLIAKLPSASKAVRAVQNALGSYAREVCFYRDLGNHEGLAVPRCYAAHFHPETGDFVLVLEDMSSSRVGNLWSSDLADVEIATDALARMHAMWWCSPKLRQLSWLPQHDDTRFHNMLGAAYSAALPIVLDRFADHVSPYLRSVALQLSARWDRWIAHAPGAPFTLVHNDCHPKQLFFPGESGGRFAIFDWQNVIAGRPTYDLSRLHLKGLRPAELRTHRDDLLRRYLNGLEGEGIHVSLDALTLEWRASLLHTLGYTVFVLARTDIEALDSAASARGVDYRERLITDLEASLQDYRVHELLE